MVTRKGSERDGKGKDTEKFHFKMLNLHKGIRNWKAQVNIFVHNKDLSIKEFFLVLLYNISLATDLMIK